MTIPKPRHLGPEYADQFKDRSVAGAYVNYPPYSDEVFEVLDGLIHDEPRVVLDIGCGTGDVARPLAQLVDRVDAVDQSMAMIEIGRSRSGGDQPNINWVCQGAEDFSYETRYSLIVAGASLQPHRGRREPPLDGLVRGAAPDGPCPVGPRLPRNRWGPRDGRRALD